MRLLRKRRPAPAAPLQPGTVLVLEPDVLVRNGVSRELRSGGFDVVECESAAEALLRLNEAYREQPPRYFDLIIADADAPGRSGIELLADLRRIDWQTPLIVIASPDDEPAHREARRLGAHAVLHRPLAPNAVRAAARAAILW